MTIRVTAVLLIACYGPLLAGLARQWGADPDMSHGFFVLPVVAYVVWRRRAELAAITQVPNWWGLAIAVWGALQMLLGTLAAQVFIARTALLLSLIGAVLFLGGTRALKILAFPLLLLLFLFPIPAILYARITLPLQIFASATAEMVLNWIGIPVLRDGNILELPHQRLSVVEACSGIRSLLSLSFLSLVYAYFFDQRVGMRWALLASTVPIAIVANAARVTLTGILSEHRTDLAQGAFHLLEGWVLFVVALGLLVTVHRLLSRPLPHKHAATKPSRARAQAVFGPFQHPAKPLPDGHGSSWCRSTEPRASSTLGDDRKSCTGEHRIEEYRTGGALASGLPMLLLSVLFVIQSAASYGLSRRTEAPQAPRPLSEFPAVIGEWRLVQEGFIEQDEKDVLRADDYLSRHYAAESGKSASIFVAYFQSQRAGQTPHSPKNCLPGSGWTWSVADTIHLNIAGRAQAIQINRYIVSKGDQHAVVLYWYQSRDRVVASEYQAAIFTAWDALRYNRTDTELVRVVTPVAQTGVEFIQAFFSLLR